MGIDDERPEAGREERDLEDAEPREEEGGHAPGGGGGGEGQGRRGEGRGHREQRGQAGEARAEARGHGARVQRGGRARDTMGMLSRRSSMAAASPASTAPWQQL